MSKTRDELAEKHASEAMIFATPTREGLQRLGASMEMQLRISFKAGWDARESELTRLREQNKILREALERTSRALTDERSGFVCEDREFADESLRRADEVGAG